MARGAAGYTARGLEPNIVRRFGFLAKFSVQDLLSHALTVSCCEQARCTASLRIRARGPTPTLR
jgi:hypothetical protein